MFSPTMRRPFQCRPRQRRDDEARHPLAVNPSDAERELAVEIRQLIYRHLAPGTKPPRDALGHLDDRECRYLGVGDRHPALVGTLDQQVLEYLAVPTSSLIDGSQRIPFGPPKVTDCDHGFLWVLDEETYLTFGGTAQLLDDIEVWFARFIAATDELDLPLLALWTVHTHLVPQLRTTARLQIDSTMPNSGKTTVLDHFSRLCYHPIQIASPPSEALIPRLLERSMRTILLDEVDRILRPDAPSTPVLLAIINSGYRFGATRPVLLPAPGGWDAHEMSTFAPVAMAGNAPNLPDDTRSRTIRVLLVPDLDGTVEDSDWEYIEDDAKRLHSQIEAFADAVREDVRGMSVDLPSGCIGRAKEKWRPLKRVAVAAGGRWPSVADELIARGLAEDDAEREAGLRTLPPGMVLLTDLHEVWPDCDDLVPTRELVTKLIAHNPDYWGQHSAYGKALSEHRFGKLAAQASKVTSLRPGGRGPRGFIRAQFAPAWRRLGIGRPTGRSGASGDSGASGVNPQDPHRMHRNNQKHRFEPDGTGNQSEHLFDEPSTNGYRRPGCVCIGQPEPCYWCKQAASKSQDGAK